jgi:hypothetical protein
VRPCACRRCHHLRLAWRAEAGRPANLFQRAIPCGRCRCRLLHPALTEVEERLACRSLIATPSEPRFRFLFLVRKVAGGRPAIRIRTMIPGGCLHHSRFPERMAAGERFAFLIRREIRNGRHHRRLCLARTVVEERLASLILPAFPGDHPHHRYLLLVRTGAEGRLARLILTTLPCDCCPHRRLAPRVGGGRLVRLRQAPIRRALS